MSDRNWVVGILHTDGKGVTFLKLYNADHDDTFFDEDDVGVFLDQLREAESFYLKVVDEDGDVVYVMCHKSQRADWGFVAAQVTKE
jgi:hypothetical protein